MALTPGTLAEHSRNQSGQILPPLPPYRSRNNSPVSYDDTRGNGERVGLAQSSTLDPTGPSMHPGETFKSSVTVNTSQEITHIEGWPEKPQKLRENASINIVFRGGEILLTLAPFLFISLGIMTASLDGQSTTNNKLGTTVKKLSQLGPTIFPILFAALAGRSMKVFARFCAERGMKIGVLELLLASQSVWGTFESQFLLRRLTVVGTHLFLLWCLSPLGGQASLRLLQTDTAYSNTTSNVLYLPTGAMIDRMVTGGVFAQGTAASGLAAVNALFTATLMSPESIKTSNQDTWKNVKIPKLDTVSNVAQSANGWATVPTLSSPDNYTSLAGLPIAGLSTNSSSVQVFEIEHAYLDLDCPASYNVSKKDRWWKEQLGLVWSSGNGSDVFYNNLTQTQTSFFLDTNTPLSNDRIIGSYSDQNATTLNDSFLQTPRNILFGSQYYTDSGYSAIFLRNCTLKLIYMEARVRCESEECQVTDIRSSLEYAQRNTNLTPLETFPVNYYCLQDLPLATGSVQEGDAAPTELFIRGSDMPFGVSSTDVPALINITENAFSTRLGLLLNTYYQLSVAPLGYTGNLPAISDASWYSLKENGYGSYPTDGEKAGAPFIPMSVNSTTTTSFKIYACNYAWLAVLLATSGLLFAVALTGVILSFRCRAPDIMGFVSSMTYFNPYVELPPGGGTLGAMERSRLLRDMKIKIGDARSGGDVGQVVFGTANGRTHIGELSHRKTYL